MGIRAGITLRGARTIENAGGPSISGGTRRPDATMHPVSNGMYLEHAAANYFFNFTQYLSRNYCNSAFF